MDLVELLATTPEDLAKKQFEALKMDAIATLRKVAELIKANKFDEISALTEHSPAGDCMGRDNDYIMFHYGDILETMHELKKLHKLCVGLDE